MEVVGVTGVMHLGQIQSGLRGAMRIAQVNVNNSISGTTRASPFFRYAREHSVTARKKKNRKKETEKKRKSFGISPEDIR